MLFFIFIYNQEVKTSVFKYRYGVTIEAWKRPTFS